MSINIEIKSIKKTDNLDIPDVVTLISYRISKEMNGKIANVDGEANLNFGELSQENFIPLSELTEDIVKGWVLSTIGDRITSIESHLDGELDPQEEKTRIITSEVKLPWVSD